MSTHRDKVLDGLLAMDKVIQVDEIDVLQPLCSRPAIPQLPVPTLNLLTPKTKDQPLQTDRSHRNDSKKALVEKARDTVLETLEAFMTKFQEKQQMDQQSSSDQSSIDRGQLKPPLPVVTHEAHTQREIPMQDHRLVETYSVSEIVIPQAVQKSERQENPLFKATNEEQPLSETQLISNADKTSAGIKEVSEQLSSPSKKYTLKKRNLQINIIPNK